MGFGMIDPDAIKAWQEAEAKRKELEGQIAVGKDWQFKASKAKLTIKSVDAAKERVAIDYDKFKGIEISYDDLKSNAEPVK